MILTLPKAAARPARLRPGVHLVTGPRPLWEALLEGSREDSGRLILLSPDPPPRGGPGPRVQRRFWFRGKGGNGSVSARAMSLGRLVPRLVSASAVSAIEGLEVLLFWNHVEDVVDFLRILDGRLVRCGTQCLVYVRPGLIDENDHAALKAHFPLSLDLRDPASLLGFGSQGPATA